MRLRIAVLMGGPSSEHEVSLASGRNVLSFLDRKRYAVTSVIIGKDHRWKFESAASVPLSLALTKLQTFDVAFLALHGQFGEDGTIQALLDAIRLPYTGSDRTASAITMDKGISNSLFSAAGLAVPKWAVVAKGQPLSKLSFPTVVKPVAAGSSVDTFIVTTPAEYRRAAATVMKKHSRVLVQKFVRGRELTCGVLEDRRGRPQALPPTEIRPKTSSWFDYRAKYSVGGSEEITPAPLTKKQIRVLQRQTLLAHTTLGCRGMSRSDFIFDGRTFWILETNTIPGLTKTSLLPQGAVAAGITFSAMLDRMIAVARRTQA